MIFESECVSIDPVLALSANVALLGILDPFLPNELVLASPEPMPSGDCGILGLSRTSCLFVWRYDGEFGVDGI